MLNNCYIIVVVSLSITSCIGQVIFRNNVTLASWTHAVYDAPLHKRSVNAKTYRNISTAQDKEDIWAYENWFYGMKGGVILESGASDGLKISTTFLFEIFAGWTAIHIEPNDEDFLKLNENRIGSINIHSALCESPKDVHFLSKGVVSGIVESMDPLHLAIHHKPVFRKSLPIESIPTKKCVPVKDILNELGVRHIDLWILDVEGAEDLVLLGMDFNQIQVNAVIMECYGSDRDKEDKKQKILTDNHFVCTKSTLEGQPAFQKKNSKLKGRIGHAEKGKPTGKNCMCKHKSFRGLSRYEKII